MNIWIFNHYAQGPELPGGTRHYDLAKVLLEKGHDVTIFAAGFHYTLLAETVVYHNNSFVLEDKEGVKFVWVKTYPYSSNNWKRMLNLVSYAWRMNFVIPKLDLQKPDVIVGSTVHPFAALIASKFAKRYKCPFVFEIRDLWPQTFIDMKIWKKNSLIARFFKCLEGTLVKDAKAIISLSPLTNTYLKQEYDYEDTIYIPNSVDLEAFQKQKTIEYERGIETIDNILYLKHQGKFIVVFTGAIVKTNNINIIIDAAQKIVDENIHIILVGEGQEKQKFQKIIETKNIKNISFSKPVQKNDLPYLLSLSDVLLLVQGNVKWGSSNKLYDYLAAKRPILTSLHVRHNDIVEDIGCGLSSIGTESLADNIKRLKDMSEEERTEMGERAFTYVKKNHDAKQMASMLESLFYKLIKA